MVIEDFAEDPSNPHCVVWRMRKPLDTPLGAFQIETLDPPDDELLAQLRVLTDFVEKHPDQVWDKLFEAYKLASNDEYWRVIYEDIPTNLTREGILPLIRHRTIQALHDGFGGISSGIRASVEWDDEHGASLRLRGGVLEFDD